MYLSFHNVYIAPPPPSQDTWGEEPFEPGWPINSKDLYGQKPQFVVYMGFLEIVFIDQNFSNNYYIFIEKKIHNLLDALLRKKNNKTYFS